MMAGCLVSQVVVLLLASWKSSATPCNSSQIAVPTRVEDTESAYRLAEAVDCSGGWFNVEWIGSVKIETAIRVIDGTTLSVTGASDGSSLIDGSNDTSLFDVIGGNLHLSKLTLVNGTAEFGGSINATDSIVTTSSCTFVGNEANYGGAVHLFDSTFEAMDTTFFGNSASLDGGAIAAIESNVTVGQGGRFEDNGAYYGGAIYSEGSSIHVADSASFLANFAFVGGGAFLWDSELETNNTTYTDNNATGYGGAICAGNSNVSIGDGARFLNNSATEHGGAVLVIEHCSLLLSGAVEFERNIANFGGAIFVHYSVVYMHGFTSFMSNVAVGSGGAVYGDLSDITITGTALWETNIAVYGAGMRLYHYCTLNVTGGITFLNNSGSQGAGMWVSERSNVIVSGSSTFGSNYARHEGGGMVVYNSTMEFAAGSTASFHNNSAVLSGGAILLYDEGEITVAGNATFANNSADVGGGIAASEASYVTLVGDVVLADNLASTAGGAIYLDAPTKVYVDGTHFRGNKALQSGGAMLIFSAGIRWDLAIVSHCVFEHNKAGDAGGALLIGGGFVYIHESQFISNNAERAGGAVMVSGIVGLKNCILVDNEARLGPAIYNAVTVSLESTDVCDNQLLCDDGSFLDWNNGSVYDVACDSCPVEGNNCTMPYYGMVQLCEPVLEHTSSIAADGTLETLDLDPGYWRSSNTSRDIRECYEAAACVGGVQDLCASGYEGPFCAVCADGHTAGLGFTCIECSGVRRKATTALGIVILVAAAVMVAISFYFLGSPATATPTGLHASCRRFGKAVSRLKCAKATQALKIVIVSWQIVTQFATVASITYPAVYAAFLRYVDVFNLNITWMLSAGCLIESNFYHSLLVSTMGPLAIAGGVLASHAISSRRCPAHDRETRAKIDGRHASVLFWMSLLVYATVSSSVFHTFACDDLDTGTSFLRSDHSLECYTTTHKIFMAYAGVMVAVFPLGIPLCYTLVLYRNRASLKVALDSETITTDVASFRELWEPYRPQVYFYEVVECLRRVLLSGVVVFIFPNTAGQVATSLLLAMFTAAVFMALDPYVSRWHTWLARIGHAVVILSLYVALLQKVDDMDEEEASQHVFACVLVATNCGLILAVGVEAYGMFSVAVLELPKSTANVAPNSTGTHMETSGDSSARVVPLTQSPSTNTVCVEKG